MKVDELINDEMYVLCAPDGSVQLATLAPDFEMCVAMAQMLATAGISKPLDKMLQQGFNIMPVLVTIKQNGDEETAFQKTKRKYSGR